MSVVEAKPQSMTETAVARFEAKQAELTVLKTYAALTLADHGIGKVEEAHKAVKRAETEIEKDRVELKSPSLEFGRMVDAKAKELQAILDPIEKHLKAQRDIHDAEKIREKLAKEVAKAAVLNERVQRMSAAGIPVTYLTVIDSMTPDEFEFFFAKESSIVAEAKAEAELQQKIAIRTARMEALGVACPSPEQIGTLSDVQFEHDYKIAKQLIDRSNAALKAEQEAEAKRQAEELRIRAEEIELQRLADEAVIVEERARMKAEREAADARLAEDRRVMEARHTELRLQQEELAKAAKAKQEADRQTIEKDRAEMRRQQEEVNRQQAELRVKAEAEAKEERRKAAEAEQTRREAAAAPELEKLEVVLKAMKNAGSQALSDCGVPRWSGEIAEHFEIFAKVARQTVLESL